MKQRRAASQGLQREDYLIRKTIQLYLLPSIVMVLAATIGMTVDGLITANVLGSTSLQALNMAVSVYFMVATLSALIGMGGGTIAGIQFGRDDRKGVNTTFTLCCILSVVCAGLLMAFGYGFLDQISLGLGGGGERSELLRAYLSGMLMGVLPLFGVQILTNFCSVDSDPGISGLAILSMAMVNIVLDIVFVTVLQMGMFGMGLATSISYAAGMLVTATHFLKKKNLLRLTTLHRQDFAQIPKLLWTGVPTASYNLGGAVRIMVFNLVLIGLGGTAVLTGYAVMNNLATLVYAVLGGIGICIGPMISVFCGEKDKVALQFTLRSAFRVGAVLSIVTGSALLLFAEPMARMFGIQTAAEFAEAVTCIRWYGVSFPIMMINVVLGAAYQNASRTAKSVVISLGRTVLFMIAWVPLTLPLLGKYTVWSSILVAEVGTLLLLVILASCKNRKFTFSPTALFYLPTEKKEQNRKIFDMSIQNTMAEVTDASVQVHNFGKAQGISPRKSYYMALSVEEMARNIVEHGFRNGKVHFIDIRVTYDPADQSCTLRLRDNGMPFDPLLKRAELKEMAPCANIGIRMICNLASSVDYRYCVGLNNLLIQL